MNPITYAKRRAAGLCANCGEPSGGAVRCERCARRLSELRIGHRAGRIGIGPRTEELSPPATLEDIGAALNCTKERARQLQEQAIAKLVRRSGLSREDVLLGLAILGVQAGEKVDSTPMPCPRGRRSRRRAA